MWCLHFRDDTGDCLKDKRGSGVLLLSRVPGCCFIYFKKHTSWLSSVTGIPQEAVNIVPEAWPLFGDNLCPGQLWFVNHTSDQLRTLKTSDWPCMGEGCWLASCSARFLPMYVCTLRTYRKNQNSSQLCGKPSPCSRQASASWIQSSVFRFLLVNFFPFNSSNSQNLAFSSYL